MYPDESLLLRELSHRINNDLTSAICAVTAKAIESDNIAVNPRNAQSADVPMVERTSATGHQRTIG